MTKANARARKVAIESAMYELLTWYASASGGKEPTEYCEDKKSYRGKVLRWLEPPLPHTDNPILIEESIGDSWTLRVEVLKKGLL